MSITFDEPAIRTEPRRDQWGRYLVVPPGKSKPIGYTRVTTVAKTLDDGGGLLPWKATLAMTGLMRRQGLRGKFEALMSQHPDKGPWYGSAESKKQAKKLVEECAEAGGSTDRADLGTALHSIVEQINKGQAPLMVQPETQADTDAYRAATEDMIIDARFCELVVVLDEWRVAGSPDMLRVAVPGLGEDVVADLKTGDNLDYSWQSIAVQMAAYANASSVYIQGNADDGSEDERSLMPPISRDVGLVIHLPAGQARCDLYTVDLASGWKAFQRSMWTRDWRKNKTLAKPLQIAPGAVPPSSVEQAAPEDLPPSGAVGNSDADQPAVEDAVSDKAAAGITDGAETRSPARTAGRASPGPQTTPPSVDAGAAGNAAPGTDARRRALLDRFEALDPVDKKRFKARAVPKGDLDAVEKLLDRIEQTAAGAHAGAASGRNPGSIPGPPQHPPLEGDSLREADIDALEQRFNELGDEAKAWTGALVAQGNKGHPWRIKRAPTVRRFELYRGVLALAEYFGDAETNSFAHRDDIVRAAVHLATGDQEALFPSNLPGWLLGRLDADTSCEFAQVAVGLTKDRYSLLWGDDGTLRLVAAG